MWNRKLGMKAQHRKAMLRNAVTSLIQYGHIETTDTRAKELRSVADELVTLAKRGDLHARRLAAAYVRDIVIDEKTNQTALQKLFTEYGTKYSDRDGGYTRVIKMGNRKGDNAPVSRIEFI